MDIRTELSKKNKYWIGKHRFLELRHYCLQYPEWKKMLVLLNGDMTHYCVFDGYRRQYAANETQRIGLLRADYSRNIELVERVAYMADDCISNYILVAVTQDKKFPYLKTVLEIPCESGMYYDRYRKFFWLLDKEKGI